MYEVNQYVFCEKIGVCQILKVDIHPKESNLNYYHLTLLSNQTLIQLYEGSIMRKVLNKDDLLELLDRIPFIRTIKAPNNKILKEFFDEALSTSDGVEWIKVIKTVYIRNLEKKTTDMDLLCDAMAKKYFYQEIAVVLNIHFNDVESYLQNYVTNIE